MPAKPATHNGAKVCHSSGSSQAHLDQGHSGLWLPWWPVGRPFPSGLCRQDSSELFSKQSLAVELKPLCPWPYDGWDLTNAWDATLEASFLAEYLASFQWASFLQLHFPSPQLYPQFSAGQIESFFTSFCSAFCFHFSLKIWIKKSGDSHVTARTLAAPKFPVPTQWVHCLQPSFTQSLRTRAKYRLVLCQNVACTASCQLPKGSCFHLQIHERSHCSSTGILVIWAPRGFTQYALLMASWDFPSLRSPYFPKSSLSPVPKLLNQSLSTLVPVFCARLSSLWK
jgi:hypothetical protein